MSVLITLSDLPSAACGGVVTIGNFDGVHRGHAVLLRQVTQLAEQLGGPSVVLTFDPHPSAILKPERVVEPLTTLPRRAELLMQQGIQQVVVCETTPQLLSLSAVEFFEQIIVGKLQARGVVEGPNFFFGRGREGNVAALAEMCRKSGREFRVIEAQTSGATELLMSSSRVRQLLQAGDLEQANRLLTAPYQLQGWVGQGEQRGRTLGFPTANLQEISVLIPAPGVYAARVEIEGIPCSAATHIGPNPTFGQAERKVEVHVLDYDGDLYGRHLAVDFIARVRDIARFASAAELQEQLAKDVTAVRGLLNQSRAD